MNVKHPNLKLACCGLLAAALLPACGGGSSSSSGAAGGTDSRTYQQGFAAGTVATVDHVLAQLNALHASLTGSTPAQTGSGTLGRSFASLEPRQREALAAELLRVIAQVRTARDAAALASAGTDEAEAAQTAANRALQALRLVAEADTAARAGGGEAGEAVRMAAINALRQITADDATPTTINTALNEALTAAEERVAELEAALAAAGSNADVASLRADLARAQARLTTAQNNLNAELVEFGDNSVPRRSTAVVRLEPRMTGMTVTPVVGYDPYGGSADWTAAPTSSASAAYRSVSDTFVEDSGRIELEPDPVLYSASDKSVISPDPHTGHFPARGLAVRGGTNPLPTPPSNVHERTGLDGMPINRLKIQGKRPRLHASDPDGIGPLATGSPRWGNWNAAAYTTFRYDATNGITMGFGGNGVIFSDLEQYVAKGGDCNYPPAVPCDDAVTGDIEISFGAPSGRDPVGEPGEPGTYYWRVQGRDPRILTTANEEDDDVKAKQAQAYADYELVLSNYAGQDAASSRRFLRHAAYGLFTFIDNIYQAGRPFPGRTQVFHYGKNAFGPDRQVSADPDDKIMAKFEGRTHGFMLLGPNLDPAAKTNHVPIAERIRIRGDVKLTANIGGATSTNTVTGTIDNLEHAIGTTGRWTDEPRFYRYYRKWDHDGDGDSNNEVTLWNIMQGRIALDASIDANGHFAGTATPGDFIDGRDRGTGGMPPAVWAAGEFEGSLYGPLDNLEAAGTWWVPAAIANTGVEALIGSFGAVCTESSNGGAGACARTN